MIPSHDQSINCYCEKDDIDPSDLKLFALSIEKQKHKCLLEQEEMARIRERHQDCQMDSEHCISLAGP